MDKAEVERMKGLLVDAITTLCRSGMRFTNSMKIEGLLGITLDEKDIVLINLNKSIGSFLNELSKNATVVNNNSSPAASKRPLRRRSVSESSSDEEEPRPKRRPEEMGMLRKQGEGHPEAGEIPVVKEEPESPPPPGHPSPTTDFSRVQASSLQPSNCWPGKELSGHNHHQSPIKGGVSLLPAKGLPQLTKGLPQPPLSVQHVHKAAHSGYVSKVGTPVRSDPPSHTVSRPPQQQAQVVRNADGEEVKIKIEIESDQEDLGSDYEGSSDYLSHEEDESLSLPGMSPTDGMPVPVTVFPAMKPMAGTPATAIAPSPRLMQPPRGNLPAEQSDYFELAPPVDVRNIVRAETIPLFSKLQPESPEDHQTGDDGVKSGAKKGPGTPQRNPPGAKSALSQWYAWAEMHEAESNEKVPPLEELDVDELNYFLSCFITELRKKDGSHYGLKTVVGFVHGVMKYLKDELGHADYAIFSDKDPRFEVFRETFETLKEQMERMAAAKARRQDTITANLEQELWNKGQLGYHSAQVLLQTVYFYNCKIFRVRTHEAHHSLTVDQFKISEDKHGQYVSFSPKKTKKTKEDDLSVIKYYNDSRHIVNIYRIYLNIISSDGESIDAFYRRPASGMDIGSLKFTKNSLGTTAISHLMKQIFDGAKIEGNFSAHSFDTMFE